MVAEFHGIDLHEATRRHRPAAHHLQRRLLGVLVHLREQSGASRPEGVDGLYPLSRVPGWILRGVESTFTTTTATENSKVFAFTRTAENAVVSLWCARQAAFTAEQRLQGIKLTMARTKTCTHDGTASPITVVLLGLVVLRVNTAR